MSAISLSHRLIDVSMLDESMCRSFMEEIHGVRHRWITRGPGRFYTLGRATYMDMVGTEPATGAFKLRLKSDNHFLLSKFAPLYERLRSLLKDVLGDEVVFASDFAIPGFHIFMGEGSVSAAKAPPHFDKQYIMLDWARNLDQAEPISFTLPLRLPRAGGGLEVWEDGPAEVETRFRRGEICSMNEYADKIGPGWFHPYRIGQLTIHKNAILHRIGIVTKFWPDDQRVTLQGHGRMLDGAWHIYW